MTSFYGGGAASTSGGGGSSAKGALVFKGTLGIPDDGATVLALPDTHEEGWTYLVVTAGTYAGQLCEKGDFVICVSSGEFASDLDWTVVQGNTFNTLPTPTALDEGKIISVDTSGNYVLIDNPSSGGGTEILPDPSEADEGKILSVGADGNYTLIDNPVDNKLDKNNGTATGTTTFDKAQANRLELLVNGESIGGFRSIDLTPAVTDNGDDSSMRFVPLFIGEPTKDAHAATKKYVDDAIAAVDAPEYTLAKQTAAEDGYFATYYLTKDGAQVGEKINIPKDYLVKEAELLEVAATDTPYSGAVIGDKYIDFTINTQASDEDEQHIYLPVKDLVDVYIGGNGININASNVVSVQIDAANSNGLALDSTGLKLNLATTSAAGAMSAADKTKLDTAITEEQLTAVENEVDTLQTEVNNIKSGTTDLGYLKATDPIYTGTLNGVNATFTGDVIVPTPDGDTEAANKSYVDTAISGAKTELEGDISTIQQTVTAVQETVSGYDDDISAVQQTVTELGEDVSNVQGTVSGFESKIETLTQAVSNITNGTTELPYIKDSGDSVSGNYSFNGTVTDTASRTSNLQLANLNTAPDQWIDAEYANIKYNSTNKRVDFSLMTNTGLTANGVKVSGAEPEGTNDFTTKNYVDTKVTDLQNNKLNKNNPAFTGTITGANASFAGTLTGNAATFSGGVTVPLEPGEEGSATSKKYVDNQIASIDVSEQIEPLTQRVTAVEGEVDTLQSNVGTIETNITNITNGTTELPYVKKSGDTVTGLLTLEQGVKNVNTDDPSYETNLSSNGFTFKHDSTVKMLSLQGNKLKFSDATAQTLVPVEVGTPIEDKDAATKGYVDENTSPLYTKSSFGVNIVGQPLSEENLGVFVDNVKTEKPLYGLTLYGGSSQEHYEGYNLLNPDNITENVGYSNTGTSETKQGIFSIKFVFEEGQDYAFVLAWDISKNFEEYLSQLNIFYYNAGQSFVRKETISLGSRYGQLFNSYTNSAHSGYVYIELTPKESFTLTKEFITNNFMILLIENRAFPFEPYTGKNPAPSLIYPTDITGIEENPVLFDFGQFMQIGSSPSSIDFESLGKIHLPTITSPLYGGYLGNMSTYNDESPNIIANSIARASFDSATICNNGLEDCIYYIDKRDYKKGKDIRVFKTLTINPTEVSDYITDGGALGNGHKFILNVKDNVKFENYSVNGLNEKEEKLLVAIPVNGFVDYNEIYGWHQRIWCNYLQSADFEFVSNLEEENPEPTTSYDTIYYDIQKGDEGDDPSNITISLSNIAIYTTRATTVEEFAAFITTPMQIVYALDEPVETDIPEDELLNLDNIHIKNNVLYIIASEDINEENLNSNTVKIIDFDITYYRVPSSNGDIYPIESLNTLKLLSSGALAISSNNSIEINNIKDKLTIANRAVFIGDSISQGYDNDDYSFVDIFKKNDDFSGVTKLAVGGATLGPYQIVSEASGYSCLEQIQANESEISGTNFCFLQFCINDVKCLASKNIQIGTPSETSAMTTVCGYLKKCIELLYTYNPTISIVFINLATNEPVIDMIWDNEVDSDADKYKFYHKVWNLSIAEVLEQYNIPMINIFDWTSINANNLSNYTVHTADGTHLNTAGNTLAYYRIKNALWNESEKSYPTQPKNLIIDATLGGNIGVENVERIKNAFDNNIQVFFNLKENEDSTEDLIVPVNFSSDVGYGSHFTLAQDSKLYLYELQTNTVGQITYTSYNITDMKANIDIALEAGTEKLETLKSYSGATYTIDSMKPNTLYNLRNVDLPTITVTAFEAPSSTEYVSTYHMIFQSNVTPVTLNLPSSVIYPEDFTIETKHIYEINIMDNLLSYQSWPME